MNKTAALLLVMAMGFGCGGVQVDPDPALARRGDTAAAVQVQGAGGASGSGGEPVIGGAGGQVTNQWSCAATLIPAVRPDGTPPLDPNAQAFENYGGACSPGGNECVKTEAAYVSSYPGSSRQFAESCSCDAPAGLPGPCFCTTAAPARTWDASCKAFNAGQLPPGMHCCDILQHQAVFVPASCGCP